MRGEFTRTTVVTLGLIVAMAIAIPAQAQERGLPGDDIVRPWGQGVAPIFEGWYPDPDGDGYYISFGYLNRNGEEIVDIPVGASNFVEPEPFNGRQPTHFETRRHYGWFTVHVPEDFGREQVVWTIDFRGESYPIPGHISNPNYEIDAMFQPATGITPPILRFEEDGEDIRGPHSVEPVSRTVSVGEPLEITVWTEDESWYGAPAVGGGELDTHTVTIRYYKYGGPGDVTFDQDNIRVRPQDELAEVVNTATFSEPGAYTVYVRANNESLSGSGQEQCCWTNAYVDVTVQP